MKGCLKWFLIGIGALVGLFIVLVIVVGVTAPTKESSPVNDNTQETVAPSSTNEESGLSKRRSANKASPDPVATQNAAADLGLTMAAFDAIKTGMTYDQVQEIIGDGGEKTVDTEIAGITGQVYQWQKWSGANMIVQFQDGRVVTKAQYGL